MKRKEDFAKSPNLKQTRIFANSNDLEPKSKKLKNSEVHYIIDDDDIPIAESRTRTNEVLNESISGLEQEKENLDFGKVHGTMEDIGTRDNGRSLLNDRRKIEAESTFGSGKNSMNASPLASRMRPQILSDFFGQEEATNFLKSFLVSNVPIPSLILWGPSGCGKTTFVRLICNHRSKEFTVVSVSAVNTGSPELKKIMERAKTDRKAWNKSTILFVDEIHRLNKAQQDVLLPYVEDGSCTLFGCTTENPSFEINSALLSRAKVIVFTKVSESEILTMLENSLKDHRGFAGKLQIEEDVLSLIASIADGDCRVAFNTLELCSSVATDGIVSKSVLSSVLQRTHTRYDKNGEMHYDIISALHKSMRGGDVNASLYWACRMLDGGENPLYIARRFIRFASEDIGLANSEALPMAVACYHACHFIGMPECNVNIAHCAAYLAMSPKSVHVYNAMNEAIQQIKLCPNESPPMHIRNAPTKLMEEIGYSTGYIYTPDAKTSEEGASQQYLPRAIEDKVFIDLSTLESKKYYGQKFLV